MENVLVIPYELISAEPQRFIGEIVEFSGADTNVDSLLPEGSAPRRVNKTRPISAIMFQRWFNYFFVSNGVNYSGLFSSATDQGIFKLRRRLEFVRLPEALDRRLERQFRSKVMRHTEGAFSQSNTELQKLVSHDLRSLGYEL